MKPLISVILPNYNNEKYIAECIESVLSQSYKNIELLICDDNSDDNSISIISSYVEIDKRVLLFTSDKRYGPAYQMNKGIEKSKGQYIARVDGDDYYHRKKIEWQYDFLMSNVEFEICTTSFEYFTEDFAPSEISLIKSDFEDIKIYLIEGMKIHGATFLCKKTVLEDIKIEYGYIFDNSIVIGEDYDLFTRIAVKCKIYNLGKVLYFYRKNHSSLTQTDKFWDLSKLHQITQNYVANNGILLDQNGNDILVSLVYTKPRFKLNYFVFRQIRIVEKKFRRSQKFDNKRLKLFFLTKIHKLILSNKKIGVSVVLFFIFYPQLIYYFEKKDVLRVAMRVLKLK